MLVKWLLHFSLVLSFFQMSMHNAFSSESYYIDNNPVLLYKIINWWYDCLPEDSNQPCGSFIQCDNKGNTHVEYNEAERILELKIDGGLAEMLSISKECESCFGPSYLHNTWLNKKYFGKGKAVMVLSKLTSSSTFVIHNMNKNKAQLIQNVEKDILFVIEGVIGGLLDGKIALHQSGNFFKSCSGVSQGLEDNYPISLKIINSHTKEVLATYSAIWEH